MKRLNDINILNLDFGAPAAERDIDHGLKEYFYESESYRKLKEENKFIILGNRGSGKSAIFKILSEYYKSKEAIIIELFPDDYSYEILSKVMIKEDQGSWAKHGAYAAAWKYLLYITVMKKLANKIKNFKTHSKLISLYLRDNHKGVEHSKLDLLISYLKRLEGVKIGPYEAGIKTKQLQSLYKLEEIDALIPEINKICRKKNVVVFIDELDRGWDASEDAKSFISGLFKAAISINQEHSPYLKVLISLRKELYDNIPALYDDAQKVADIFETIDWNEESLFKMITKRIKHSFPSLKEYENETVWGLIFSYILDYRKAKSFNYMIDRTLFRPREIINFCTVAKEKAIEYSQIPIDYQIIADAEFVYSENRTKDIASEYKFQYPGLLKIFELFRGKVYTFERDDLELLCLEIIESFNNDENISGWISALGPKNLIDILWQIGFIRAQAIGNLKAQSRSGSRYLGSHQISNLNLDNIKRFHVHPMFRTYLGMKETRYDK